jgi:hypothetical protein
VIFRRLLMACVAIVMIATSGGVVIVAAAYAVFALAKTEFGPAGAAAVTALVFAIVLAIGGFLAAPKPRKRTNAPPGTSAALAEELMELVRDKPLASAGVALAAGIMAMRNPKVIGEVLRGLLQKSGAEKRKR